MNPVAAKLIAAGLALVAIGLTYFIPAAAPVLYGMAGAFVGKEYLQKTGDVSVTTHPDDIR